MRLSLPARRVSGLGGGRRGAEEEEEEEEVGWGKEEDGELTAANYRAQLCPSWCCSGGAQGFLWGIFLGGRDPFYRSGN